MHCDNASCITIKETAPPFHLFYILHYVVKQLRVKYTNDTDKFILQMISPVPSCSDIMTMTYIVGSAVIANSGKNSCHENDLFNKLKALSHLGVKGFDEVKCLMN